MVGTCYLVTDHNMIPNLAYQSRIVSITEGNPFGNAIQVVEASVLMPPYQAMLAHVDGDIARFKKEYINYLASTDAATTLIAIIGRALLQGVNITLFIPKDEAQLFADTLLEFMFGAFGIVVGTEKIQFMLTGNAQLFINVGCYLADVITLEEFLSESPRDLMLFESIAHKVGIDYDLFYDLNYIVNFIAMLWDQQRLNGHLLERVQPIKFSADKP